MKVDIFTDLGNHYEVEKASNITAHNNKYTITIDKYSKGYKNEPRLLIRVIGLPAKKALTRGKGYIQLDLPL